MVRISQNAGQSQQQGLSEPSALTALSLKGLPRHDNFTTAGEAAESISRSTRSSVDTRFVSTFFALKDGTIDLPPKPRQDSAVCEKIESMIERVNVAAATAKSTKQFIHDMCESASTRVLSPYELQIMEFAVAHRDKVSIFFEPLSGDNEMEVGATGHLKVYIGKKSYFRNGEFSPSAAFGVLMHELSHARDVALGLDDRGPSGGVIASELKANICECRGDLAKALSVTATRYEEHWKGLKKMMPGFEELVPKDKVHYIWIMAKHRVNDEFAFLSASNDLVSAFPSLSEKIGAFEEKARKVVRGEARSIVETRYRTDDEELRWLDSQQDDEW
jgi:hypothetical protein